MHSSICVPSIIIILGWIVCVYRFLIGSCLDGQVAIGYVAEVSAQIRATRRVEKEAMMMTAGRCLIAVGFMDEVPDTSTTLFLTTFSGLLLLQFYRFRITRFFIHLSQRISELETTASKLRRSLWLAKQMQCSQN
jgi:hypothetical protein